MHIMIWPALSTEKEQQHVRLVIAQSCCHYVLMINRKIEKETKRDQTADAASKRHKRTFSDASICQQMSHNKTTTTTTVAETT